MKKALVALPGVEDVKVNYKKKTTTVTVKADGADDAAIIKALKDAGFVATVKEKKKKK